jgi:hypothetical protein
MLPLWTGYDSSDNSRWGQTSLALFTIALSPLTRQTPNQTAFLSLAADNLMKINFSNYAIARFSSPIWDSFILYSMLKIK